MPATQPNPQLILYRDGRANFNDRPSSAPAPPAPPAGSPRAAARASPKNNYPYCLSLNLYSAMVLIPATCSAVPLSPLPTRTFLISELTQARDRVAALAQKHPSWPSSRVRAQVARELQVSTVQLRYMLRKAAETN